jgi:glycosyltransferase involved in cell wall biosynthesis
VLLVSEQLHVPLVSFVLPAYNEGRLIENTLQRLNNNFENNGLPFEIVVVDDGSIDNTRSRAICYSLDNKKVKVIGYKKNIGKGFAINTGFRIAKGDAVILFDSDSDIDTKQIQRFIDPLKEGDIVIGSKWHPDSMVNIPVARRLLSYGFNVLARLLTGVPVKDTQTGLKALRREAFQSIFSRLCVKRYAFDVELLVLAKIYGLKIIEVPVNLNITEPFSLRNIWRMFIDLLGIAYRLRIRKWYQRGIA